MSLAEASGLTPQEIRSIVQCMQYSPHTTVHKAVGQVGVSLNVVCLPHSIDPQEAAVRCLDDRIASNQPDY